MGTNTKLISTKIQRHMLEYFESFEHLIEELKHYQKNFGFNFGKTMAEYGTFAVYYDQVKEALMSILDQTEAEADKYDTHKQWQLYCHLINREARNILSNKCYIK